MVGATANAEELQSLQAEKDKASEKLAGTEQKLSLLEQEKQRIQKVQYSVIISYFYICFFRSMML